MHSLEGALSKWTNLIKGWQFRWFVLDDQTGILSYYTSKENMTKGERRGCIRLKGAHVGYDDEDDVTFTIKVDDKTFHLQAKNLDEREKWVAKIEELIELHSNFTLCKDTVSLSNQDTQNFDLNLTESDSYLQLLIDELKILETKRDSLLNEDDIKKYNLLIASTKNFIETVKNAIICLQIAKVNRDPTNSLHTANDLKNVLSNLYTLKEASLNLAKADTNPNLNQAENALNISTDIIRRAEKNINISNKIPVASYSSSDDESFYDAIDENSLNNKNSVNHDIGNHTDNSISNNLNTTDNETKETENNLLINNTISNSTNNNINNNNSNNDSLNSNSDSKENEKPNLEIKTINVDNTIAQTNNYKNQSKYNYDDSLYENYGDDEEQINLNNQQNVISHLLSQVRIGMDLSKITLPTFILERRSLLEMYADFFAQTQLFVQIPDIEHPRDRIIQVVKWYLSAFHSGRKSDVAKKPYNPILGEIFQCWYTIPHLPEDPVVVSDGPVPWAMRSQVTFISEQVSHHPPISAFYAEHYNKRIQVGGYIWTKSKFLGLSIGVHMIGKAVINLLDRDEDYIFTFPSAYGRSVLTVPWFEMGGKITINCPKSGYSADIDFLTKPFYSGKKNQILGNIHGPDKKPIITLDGEWTGVVYAKYGKRPPEIFVNPHNCNYVKKQLRPIGEQNEYESRRLWYDVTQALKKKQIDNATVAKQTIEQKQREDAKYRKDNNIKWKQRYFIEQGEDWIYTRPLIKRLQQEKHQQQQQQ